MAVGLQNAFPRGHGLQLDRAELDVWWDKEQRVNLKGFSQDRLQSVGKCINMVRCEGRTL